MEPKHSGATMLDVANVVASIDQKALRLSALLREIDNEPLAISPEQRDALDGILEQLSCRIAATRALMWAADEAPKSEPVPA